MKKYRPKVVFIGAGNLATSLAKALFSAGIEIVEIFSRTAESAQMLADAVNAQYTTELECVTDRGDLYVVSLKDAAFVELLPRIVRGREGKTWIHTAGSIPMDIWKGYVQNYGVFYPMQTFSKERTVSFENIPLFVEGSSVEVTERMTELAGLLSRKVANISSEQRKRLHLAAVFACNFSNHAYAVAEAILKEQGLGFDVMLNLVDETARKVHELSPALAQTGPAVRYDRNVMGEHLELLKDHPEWQKMYEMMSQSIHEMYVNTVKEDKK